MSHLNLWDLNRCLKFSEARLKVVKSQAIKKKHGDFLNQLS